MLTAISPHKALEYFETKLEFQLGPMELNEMIKRGEVNVIDVRTEKDYREGHIPRAISLPKEKWNSFKGLSRDKTNVVYCYSVTCFLATRACKLFAENDYPVMELIGGFEEWKSHTLPVEK
jgi:rhodanese-related sulfurtransferase